MVKMEPKIVSPGKNSYVFDPQFHIKNSVIKNELGETVAVFYEQISDKQFNYFVIEPISPKTYLQILTKSGHFIAGFELPYQYSNKGDFITVTLS